MAKISSLSAPGVEVREYDESLRLSANAATTVFVPGFAAQGPIEEVIPISSMNDFETVYGAPTNAAERYFYYTVWSLINSGNGTTVLTSRLAYGAGEGDNVASAYTLLAYPAVPVKKIKENTKGYTYYTTDVPNRVKIETSLNLLGEEVISDAAANVTSEVEFIPSVSFDYSKSLEIKGFVYDEGLAGIPTMGADAVSVSGIKITYLYAGKEVESEYLTIASEIIDNNAKGIVHICGALGSLGSIKITVESADKTFIETIQTSDNRLKVSIVPVEPETSVKLVPCVGDFSSVSYQVQESFEGEDVTYVIGSPATFQVSLEKYYQIISGENFAWNNNAFDADYFKEDGKFGKDLEYTLAHSAFIMINASRSTINDNYEGYYIGLTDNLFNEPNYDLNAIKEVKFTNWNTDGTDAGIIDKDEDSEFSSINKSRLDFYLDSNHTGSISRILQTTTSTFDTSGTFFDDTLNLALFKLKTSTVSTEVMKLAYNVVEKYNASLGKTRTYSISNATTPQSYFIENVVDGSRNITFMVNKYVADNIHVDINGDLKGKVRVLSSKLIENYEKLQQKYIFAPVSKSENKKAIDIIRHAEIGLKNWKNLVAQVGVSIEIIKMLESGIIPNICDSCAGDHKAFRPLNALFPFASYSVPKSANKIIGSLPAKLTRTLELIANDEEYPDIDIIVEGGLGTVYAYSNATPNTGEASQMVYLETNTDVNIQDNSIVKNTFDENVIINGIEDLRTARTSLTADADNVIEDWLAVQNAFRTIADSFQNGGRGDCFYIPDILRGIVIKGANTKVEKLFGTKLDSNGYGEDEVVNHSWSTSIYYPIKHLVDRLTTSYASIYAQWFKVADGFTNEKYWIPASGYMAALMCATDQLQGPWYAAAGLNRGIVTDVLDCAINPNQKQRGDLYKICVNSVPKIANVGITCWGIRTLSKKASAFDQNTCRRTFLYIEKNIKKLLRYYLFEPNNYYTQLSIFNTIDPWMESLKNQGAIYSYVVQCNSANNTEEIVNNGNLAVDVSAAPTRTAEFIVLNMTANKYTQEVSTSEFSA